MSMTLKRRDFLRGILTAAAATFVAPPRLFARRAVKRTGPETSAVVCRALRGSPEENLEKVIGLCGGIESIIEEDAVVIIKPNVQWWNQGVPHLGVVRRLVELIVERPGGFRGEVVVAENCHRGADSSKAAGWARPFERNQAADAKNMGELVAVLKRRHGDRFTVRHWIDVAAGAARVHHPREGGGYVYCDGTGGVPLLACGNDRAGEGSRRTVMTYPIFLTDRGTIVDFKSGVWEGGAYTGQPVRFINLAALNHHSVYCGMTSAVKNYLGVTDLSGGADPHAGGKVCGEYYNFHAFPFDHWGKGPQPGMLGRAVGTFMKTVRRADLNIVTAEWVGLSSRVDPPVARTRAVLASTDPVALDFHSAKYLLHPNSGIAAHDPERVDGPLWNDLKECSAAMGGVLDETKVMVRSYDMEAGRLQTDEELMVSGEIEWGADPKALLKYAYLRAFH